MILGGLWLAFCQKMAAVKSLSPLKFDANLTAPQRLLNFVVANLALEQI